jgi:hypothetical protein
MYGFDTELAEAAIDVNTGYAGPQADEPITVTYGAWVALATAVAELKKQVAGLTQPVLSTTMADRWLSQTEADDERD